MIRAVPLVLALFLVGCVVTTSPQKSLLVACQGYSSTLVTLAGFRAGGKLDADEIATVDALRPTLNAICLDGDFTTTESALNSVENAMFQLIQIERSN